MIPNGELNDHQGILVLQKRRSHSGGALAIRKTLGCSDEHAAVISKGLKTQANKDRRRAHGWAFDTRRVPKSRHQVDGTHERASPGEEEVMWPLHPLLAQINTNTSRATPRYARLLLSPVKVP